MLHQNLTLVATVTGFGLGAGAIFSIGPQNLKLIQSGVLRRNSAVIATPGYLSEIVIVVAGVCGVGTMLEAVPRIELAMRVVGVAFLLWCAFKALGSSGNIRNWTPSVVETRRQAIVSMLATTWLNPLVYVEIMLLVGVLSSNYDGVTRSWFAFGFLAASCLRFFGLPIFGQALERWLHTPRAQSTFNRVAGLLLLIVAASQAAAIA